MVAVLKRHSFGFRQQKRLRSSNQPRMEAEAEGQRLRPKVLQPKPHVHGAAFKRICHPRLVAEWAGTIRRQRKLDPLSRSVLDRPCARKAVAVDRMRLARNIGFERMKSSTKPETAS